MPNSPSHSRATKDYNGLYNEVSELFEDWTEMDGSKANTEVKNSIYDFLKSNIQSSIYEDFTDEISIPRYSSGCDLAISDKIGIVIIYKIPNSSTNWIHQRLKSLFESYRYLIVYGHQIQQKDIDSWRQIKKSMKNYSKYRYRNEYQQLTVFDTVKTIEYRIPMTNRYVAKYMLEKLLAFGLWVVFTIAGGMVLDYTSGGDTMTQAYMGAIITFNVIVILFLILVIRM